MPLSTGRSLRTIDAARLLGVDDPEKFRVLAKRAGVLGERGRDGRRYFSEAEVEAVRAFKRRTSWERVLADDDE
jgi:hypothetical protein